MAGIASLSVLLLATGATPSAALAPASPARVRPLVAMRAAVSREAKPAMITRELLLTRIAPSFGTVAANAMFLSVARAVLAVRESGSIGDLNAVPLVCIVGNCAAWLGYSFATKNGYIFASNLPGLLLGLFYTMTAVKYAPDAARKSIEKLLIGYAGIIGAGGFAAATGIFGSAQAVFGMLANALLVLYYSAPLSTLAKVISTRSAASLHAPLCFMNGFNGLMWTAYGLAVADPFVWAINGLGAVLAAVQLMLVGVFRG